MTRTTVGYYTIWIMALIVVTQSSFAPVVVCTREDGHRAVELRHATVCHTSAARTSGFAAAFADEQCGAWHAGGCDDEVIFSSGLIVRNPATSHPFLDPNNSPGFALIVNTHRLMPSHPKRLDTRSQMLSHLECITLLI
ncbi:MAG: hypothetical protein O3A46_05800 [Candidatus Poribacteria bacterium]|nr:hypothetical protein [Candidatus Poribacteria bacterium]